jgi:glycosyltransferase involved in cell wall biosynthesis
MPTESSPLRLLMVAARCFPYLGGVETHIYEVGKRLVRAGVEVTVLSTDVSGKLPIVEEIEGMHIRRVRAWPRNKDYYFAPDLYRVITRGQWDIVHCQGYHNLVAPLAMFAAQRAKIPYVVTFHSGGDSSRLRKAFRSVQRMALRPLLARAELLISPSKWELEFFRDKLHLPDNQFVIIPNGAHHLSQSINSSVGIAEGTLILSIGRLEQYKGHHRLIAAKITRGSPRRTTPHRRCGSL